MIPGPADIIGENGRSALGSDIMPGNRRGLEFERLKKNLAEASVIVIYSVVECNETLAAMSFGIFGASPRRSGVERNVFW